MRYWWVNQNQTYRHEIGGGYLWSPKRNANGARNPFYESMREVAPGDLIFSFMDTRILALGIAQSYCWESPKPLEFGTSGQNWEDIGWRVKVRFAELGNKVRPKDHIDVLRPMLPAKYSPLQPNGNGLQSVYLTEVPTTLAEVLVGLIGQEVAPIAMAAANVKPISADDLDFWEKKLEQGVAADASIPETDRVAIVRARVGQGLFKERVGKIESKCRITGVENPVHLVASHCKPWRDSTNDERLNGENGLLLTPSIDHLFDRGFIGFENNGALIISPVAHRPSLQRMGLFVYQPPLSEFLTLEKTAVTAAGAVTWRIAEPKRFFETVVNKVGAESRLGDVLSAELGAAIGRSPLAAFVSAEAYRAEALLAEVAAKCRNVALRDYGIEVLDVQLLRFDFPKRNRLTVYARMRSERAAISMRYRSEGEEEGLKIRSAAQGEKTSILAEAFKVAQRHRGTGEAEAARVYADSLRKAPQFYALRRTLDASRKFVKEGTTMVLPANSDLFGLLYDSSFYERAKPPASLADSARKETPMR